MGKNQRHKKNLKADKAKVKLKQTKTKFLPKGQNVTNTSFKIKPIVLQEQLKEKLTDLPLTKRNLDIKDLLSRIKHYNENVRYKACEEMCEMIKFYTEDIVNHHLAVVILSISALMQDKERKVRREASKVVNTILGVVPDEKLCPFYSYFLVNLRCAMTNINKFIQEDSLMFLDSFLLHNSNIIYENPEKLLPDFFTLISKLRSDSNLERTLTVNLGSKMTSVTWRIKVLSRLHAVLEKVLGTSLNNVNSIIPNKLVFNADLANTFPIYKTKLFELCDVNLNFDKNYCNVTSTENLEKNIITVVPLLYETWIEVMPDRHSGNLNKNTKLTDEGAAILTCITNTLYLLWKYVQNTGDQDFVKKVFLSVEGKKFLDHLVCNFPYKQSENIVKKTKTSNELKILVINSDIKCCKENILICLIYSALSINISKRTKNSQMDSVVEFISNQLAENVSMEKSTAKVLFEFVKMCLIDHYSHWRKSGIDLRLILDGAIQFYNNRSLSSDVKLELFKLLADLIDFPFVQKSELYVQWLECLPDLLLQPKISSFEVSCLLNMSKRGSSAFHEALNRKLPRILENLDTLQIIVNNPSILNTDETVKRNIANIFFYLPKIGKIKSRIIFEYMNTHQGSQYTNYLEKMLLLRKEFGR